MGVEFVIRSHAIHPRRGAFVFARAVAEETYFRVPPGSTLGGVPVQPYVDMPFRDLPDGTPDLPVFLFELVESGDERRIQPGTAVTLEPGGYCSKHDFMEDVIRPSRATGPGNEADQKRDHDSHMRALEGPPVSDAEIEEIVRREIREARPKKPWWRRW